VATHPGTIEFPAKGVPAAASGILQVVLLALALGACYLAYQDPSRVSIGIAGALSLLLVFLAFRGGKGPTQVKIVEGELDVTEPGSRYRFDLTNPKVRVEMPEPPTSRRWKVLVHRIGMAPYEIDARKVSPVEFTEALRKFRPDL
jgi:hypothetical protein